MTVVSVKFKGRGKTYFFDPNGIDVSEGAQVVVETSKGLELVECVRGNHEELDERIVPPLRPVIRIATPDDLRVAELCKSREKEAFDIAEQKIAERGLDMKLVDVECNFDGSKILFFFTSDGRVDFRELVKDLAGVFRTRIELRQIGVRDEAKMMGGIGLCGRPYCCHQFLDDFEPVSTKMAKTQSLSLNPTKISGACGRLMCCLRYEQEAYEELVKNVPKTGAFVETVSGYGNVTQVNLLRQKVKVKMDGDDTTFKTFDADEVATVPGGRPKPGDPLPHVLEVVAKPKPIKEETVSEWVMPPVFAEDTVAEVPEKENKPEKKGDSRHRHRNHGKKPHQEQANASSKQEKPKHETEEKPAGATEKKSNSHHHHRKSGGNGHSQQQKPKDQSSAPEGKPSQVQAQKAKPAEGGQKAKPAEGGQKGSGSHHHHRKPKPKPKNPGNAKPE